MPGPNWLLLLASIGLSLAAGAVGAMFSARECPRARLIGMRRWQSLRGTPPNNWFAPVWIVLYVLMGTAVWLIGRERYHRGRSAALAAYFIQLLLNALWAPVFFGAKNVGAGLFVIVALWLAIAWTLREFAAVRSAAAWLMVPYFLWVSFASALNLSIWKLKSVRRARRRAL